MHWWLSGSLAAFWQWGQRQFRCQQRSKQQQWSSTLIPASGLLQRALHSVLEASTLHEHCGKERDCQRVVLNLQSVFCHSLPAMFWIKEGSSQVPTSQVNKVKQLPAKSIKTYGCTSSSGKRSVKQEVIQLCLKEIRVKIQHLLKHLCNCVWSIPLTDGFPLSNSHLGCRTRIKKII